MYRIVRSIAILAVMIMLAAIAAAPAVAADTVERPLKGTIVGGGAPVPDASCLVGVRTDSWGTGQVTHLGLTTFVSSHCQAPMGDVIHGGAFTLVAADGNTIRGTYSINVDPFEFGEGAVLTGSSPNVITGGTGRFAGASGAFLSHFRGVLHLAAPMELTWWLDGEINY
jgi:hypothetical protein